MHGNQVAKVADGYSFPSGEGVTYKNFTTLTDCTTVDNEFEYEAQAGTNLKQNYEITCEYGKLTINPITTELKVTASSKSKTYDRTELSDNTFTYTENVLQGEDRLDVTFDTSSTITNAGSVVNKIAGIKVKRGNNDITGNYSNITSEDGVLTVNPRSIILTSGTKS